MPTTSAFQIRDEPIVGAASVNHLFKGWRAGVQRGDFPPPWEVPVTPPVDALRPEIDAA